MISKVNRYVLALGLSTAFIVPSLQAHWAQLFRGGRLEGGAA